MHLGILTSEYPHPKVNHAAGIATSIGNLVLTLVKKGIQVSVFVYHQDIDDIIDHNGVKIHLIKGKKHALLGWYLYRKHIQNYVNASIKKDKIDILEAPDWTGITAFMKLSVPLVIRFHGSDAYFCKLYGRKQKFKNRLFESNALSKAAAYIAPTSYAGEETGKIFNLDPSKIKTINYGLDLDKFENQTPTRFDENTILYIGTIIRKKGVFELAEVFNKVHAKNPKAKLILIGGDAPDIKSGSASTYAEIKKIFADNALTQVSYLGRVPYSEIQSHINNAAVCVFPSFAETFGMVTIESMALHKAVVNTSIGWAQELIDDKRNGYLIHPSDVNAYANQILELLADKDLIISIGKEARKKVEDTFDINYIADINIAYFKSLIKT